jgi:hypothetical protein
MKITYFRVTIFSWDTSDASQIVSFVLSREEDDSLAQKYGLQRPAEEIHAGDAGEP